MYQTGPQLVKAIVQSQTLTSDAMWCSVHSIVPECQHCLIVGEAQKIDRIMEKFAERYCKDNPDVFKTADGAYLLSFALIMLNTDAHNPMADKKLSLEDFVSMCQYQVRSYLSLLVELQHASRSWVRHCDSVSGLD